MDIVQTGPHLTMGIKVGNKNMVFTRGDEAEKKEVSGVSKVYSKTLA